MRRILLVCSVLSVLGCDPSPACDPGQRAELGSCFAIAKDAGSKPAPMPEDDAGGKPAQPKDCTPHPGNYVGFGDPCTGPADCHGCVAPNCATAPINMCTRTECQNDPQACPPGWKCIDVSAFSGTPDTTHVCLKM